LKRVNFSGNEFKYIEPEIIEPLMQMDYVDFTHCFKLKCLTYDQYLGLNLCYSRDGYMTGDCTLEDIKKEILARCPVPDEVRAKFHTI
jgi:hypothetical protein